MNSPPARDLVKNQPAIITGLGAVETAMHGIILEASARTMLLEAGYALVPGRPLKIEAQDTLWLGEVLHCEQDGEQYRLEVALAHALYGLADLARLAERFVSKPRVIQETTAVARN